MFGFGLSQSKSPLTQTYTYPIRRITTNIIISTKANQPRFLKTTAQGSRQTTSTSNNKKTKAIT